MFYYQLNWWSGSQSYYLIKAHGKNKEMYEIRLKGVARFFEAVASVAVAWTAIDIPKPNHQTDRIKYCLLNFLFRV